MNKKQYNNVIDYTLKHDQSDNDLATARAIFNNMGVALPQGDIKAVYETIKTNDYMGWKSCTMQEAQTAADNGIAAIGINEERIVVLSATDEEQPVTQTASVMTLDENTSAYAVDDLKFYSNIRTMATEQNTMTVTEYYQNILNTPLIYRSSNGNTYCNIWAQNVLNRCNIPYPTGNCATMLNAFNQGYSKWIKINNSNYVDAQLYANSGYATIAITSDHIAVVTPNNIKNQIGTIPTSVGKVLISQSGASCFYEKTLSYGWSSPRHSEIQFFYYTN